MKAASCRRPPRRLRRRQSYCCYPYTSRRRHCARIFPYPACDGNSTKPQEQIAWPDWWFHFHGVGKVTWNLTLEAGESSELTCAWNYYWR
jgi:hypothetical protein